MAKSLTDAVAEALAKTSTTGSTPEVRTVQADALKSSSKSGRK